MLTDKQSLILCAIVALGFSACGIIGILENFAVIGLLLFCFLIIIINIIVFKSKNEPEELSDELDDTDKTKN